MKTWNGIPEDVLKSAWAAYCASKRKTTKKDVDPARRAYLDKKAESMRRLRDERKK